MNRIRSDHTREPGEGRLWLQSRLKPTVRYRPNSGHSRRSDLRIHRIHTSGCRYIEPAFDRVAVDCAAGNGGFAPHLGHSITLVACPKTDIEIVAGCRFRYQGSRKAGSSWFTYGQPRYRVPGSTHCERRKTAKGSSKLLDRIRIAIRHTRLSVGNRRTSYCYG